MLKVNVLLAIALSSCGSGGSSSGGSATSLDSTSTTGGSTTGVASVQCAGGWISVNGINCSYAPAPGNFDSACTSSGGLVQTAAFNNGADICQTRTTIVENASFGYVPVQLANSTVGAASVQDTRYTVYPGDQLLIATNTSQFGTYSSGFFSTCSPRNPPTGEGLYISDSVSSYSAQTPGNVIVIQGTGHLQFGFNATTTTGCSTIGLVYDLVRCMDSSGHIYKCQNPGI